MLIDDDSVLRMAAVPSALLPMFRGRFCDLLWPNRDARVYERGDKERILFFIRHGVVKTGTITSKGLEITYVLRKDGDVAGELYAPEFVHRDRAVAVERTEVVSVTFDEIVDTLAKHPALLRGCLAIFCRAFGDSRSGEHTGCRRRYAPSGHGFESRCRQA